MESSHQAILDLTTQSPFEVWLAIPSKARAPRMDYSPPRIARFSGAALTDGIEAHQIDGVTVRVTNAARTVADCFKCMKDYFDLWILAQWQAFLWKSDWKCAACWS